MPKLLLAFAVVISSVTSFSQTSQFKKGQIDLNIGVGFITPLFEITDYDIKTKTPPVSITADYGVADDVSVGLYLASAKDEVYGTLYRLNNGSTYYGKQSTVTHTLIGGRVLYHFELTPKLDTYAGGMLGYNAVTETAEPNVRLYGNAKATGFTYTILGGGRYRFTPHAGVFLELGYGVSIINLGLNLKL